MYGTQVPYREVRMVYYVAANGLPCIHDTYNKYDYYHGNRCPRDSTGSRRAAEADRRSLSLWSHPGDKSSIMPTAVRMGCNGDTQVCREPYGVLT